MPAGLGRLRTRPEFLRVAGARRKCVKPGLILQVRSRAAGRNVACEGEGASEIRVGFTASRKVGTAVARNRARRRLRAAAREIMTDHAAPGHDYVLIARRQTLTRSYAGLVRDLESALKRLGVYRGAGRRARAEAVAAGAGEG